MSVSLTSRTLSADETAYLGELGEMSRTLGTRTMARAVGAEDATPRSVLIELKGVDSLYPLYGRMELEGEGSYRNCLPSGTVCPEPWLTAGS